MDVIDLIWLGGGFEDELHLRNTYLDKGILLRWDIMNKLSKSKIPLGRLSFKREKYGKHGITNGDEIRIFSIDEVFGLENNEVKIKVL